MLRCIEAKPQIFQSTNLKNRITVYVGNLIDWSPPIDQVFDINGCLILKNSHSHSDSHDRTSSSPNLDTRGEKSNNNRYLSFKYRNIAENISGAYVNLAIVDVA